MSHEEMSLVKVKITREMAGQSCFIPENYNSELFKKIAVGETVICDMHKIPDSLRRSLPQLGLYWTGCRLIAHNSDGKSWNTPEKVSEQIKLKLRFIDVENIIEHEYTNRHTGEKETRLHIKTRSIAFKNLKHLNACGFFDEAFELMAEIFEMDKKQFIELVKFSMSNKSLLGIE